MPYHSPADYRANAAVELQNAAEYRAAMVKGTLPRDLAIPGIRESLRMARVMTVAAHMFGQV